MYESYVDLVPDLWTDVAIRVRGLRAEHGAIGGGIGLWIGSGTRACFAGLGVTPG